MAFNFSNTTPAAPSGSVNMAWATDGSGNISASLAALTPSGVQQESYIYAADTGTANAYAVALTPAPTIVAGSVVVWKALHANTGASTLAVNSGTATAIHKLGATVLAAGDISVGQILTVVYDGSVWQLSAGTAGATGATGPAPTGAANLVLATPNGSSGTATLRALVAADVPTLNQSTTGTASNIAGSGFVAIANGGTGAITAATALANLSGASLVTTNLFQTANAFVEIAAPSAPSSGTVVMWADSTAATMAAQSPAGVLSYMAVNNSGVANKFVSSISGGVMTLTQPAFSNLTGTATIAQGGTGQTTATLGFNALSPMTTLGDTLYGGASGAGTRLAGSTSATKQFHCQTGTGTVSAAPVWASILAADVPTLNQSTTGTAANVTGTVAIANGGTGQTTALLGFNALSPMTTLGDHLYGGASGAGTRLAGNITTAKQYLQQTGTGTVSAAPVWASIAGADVSGVALLASANAFSNTGTNSFAGAITVAGLGSFNYSASNNWVAITGASGYVAGFSLTANAATWYLDNAGTNSTPNNRLRFYSPSGEVATILSGGNVGIGNSSPGSLFTVGSNLFTIAATSGNTAIAGTLSVTGTVSLGAFAPKMTAAQTGNYSVLSTDHTILCNPTANSTVTMLASPVTYSEIYVVNISATYTITVSPNGNALWALGGGSTLVIAVNSAAILQYDGATWRQIR